MLEFQCTSRYTLIAVGVKDFCKLDLSQLHLEQFRCNYKGSVVGLVTFFSKVLYKDFSILPLRHFC